jgi:hypothetical protein
MAKAADDLVIEIGLGRPAASEAIANGLLAELRPTVPDLARERASGRALAGLMLDDMADRLEAAADGGDYWPRHAGNRPPLPHESLVRALVARLRMLARN